MRWRLIVGLGFLAVGIVWIGQGVGLLKGSSFMVDDLRWAVAGAVLAVVGVALAVSARRARGGP